MGFLNQAVAQRKCLQAIDCKLSGLDVIYDICNVPVCICIQQYLLSAQQEEPEAEDSGQKTCRPLRQINLFYNGLHGYS